MDVVFDSEEVAQRGWRQGAILGEALAKRAEQRAPGTVSLDSADWLVLTNHDCDILNASLDKEPVAEVLRMRVAHDGKADRQQAWGRNPRALQLAVEAPKGSVVLSCVVHDRWTIPRALLMEESPAWCLPDDERRLIASWLAKRYIRAAFPTAFDQRWRSEMRGWQKLLRDYSEWLQAVYLRLDTLDELPSQKPYRIHLIAAVSHRKRGADEWAGVQRQIREKIEAFWSQFAPGIEFIDVAVRRTDEISLADIEPYQRFDADWVSFEDETPVTPPVVNGVS